MFALSTKAALAHPPLSAGLAMRETGGAVPLAGQVLAFAHDSRIFDEGDATRSFYKVLGGVVRTCKYRSDGRRQIDGFHGEGDVFGLESGREHGLSAEAVSDCTVISYRWHGPDGAFGAGVRSDQILKFAMRSLQKTRDHALLLGGASAAQKVASFLFEMVERGRPDAAIDLVMCRQDIADYLGLTMETVSRTLSHFERRGFIALPSARHVVLRDRGGLEDHCRGLAFA